MSTRAAGEPLTFGIESLPPTRERLAELLQPCGLSLAVFLMLQVLPSVLSPLISWLRGVDKRTLLSALLLLTAGFGAALLYTPSRKWLLEHYQTIASRIGPALLDFCDGLQVTAANYAHIRQEAQEATHTIEQFRRRSAQPRTAHDYAGKVLAAAPEPLHIRIRNERNVPAPLLLAFF